MNIVGLNAHANYWKSAQEPRHPKLISLVKDFILKPTRNHKFWLPGLQSQISRIWPEFQISQVDSSHSKSFIKITAFGCLASRGRFPRFGKGFQTYHFHNKYFAQISHFGSLSSKARFPRFGNNFQNLRQTYHFHMMPFTEMLSFRRMYSRATFFEFGQGS